MKGVFNIQYVVWVRFCVGLEESIYKRRGQHTIMQSFSFPMQLRKFCCQKYFLLLVSEVMSKEILLLALYTNLLQCQKNTKGTNIHNASKTLFLSTTKTLYTGTLLLIPWLFLSVTYHDWQEWIQEREDDNEKKIKFVNY